MLFLKSSVIFLLLITQTLFATLPEVQSSNTQIAEKIDSLIIKAVSRYDIPSAAVTVIYNN